MPEEGPEGSQGAPRRPPGAAPLLAAPGGRLGTLAHLWLPPLAYITSSFQKPSRGTPHRDFHLCSTAVALPRSGASEDLFPAPCRREGSPPGASPPPWALPGCVVSSPPWTMGPWSVAMWCLLSNLVLQFLALVSCPTWSRHLCNSFCCCYAVFAGIRWIMRLCSNCDELYIWFSFYIFVLEYSCMFSVAVYCFGQVVGSDSKRERYAWLWVHAPRCLAWVTETWD